MVLFIPGLYHCTDVLFAFLSQLWFLLPSHVTNVHDPSAISTSVFQVQYRTREAGWPLPPSVLLWQQGTWLSTSRCAVPLEQWILLGSLIKTSLPSSLIHFFTQWSFLFLRFFSSVLWYFSCPLISLEKKLWGHRMLTHFIWNFQGQNGRSDNSHFRLGSGSQLGDLDFILFSFHVLVTPHCLLHEYAMNFSKTSCLCLGTHFNHKGSFFFFFKSNWHLFTHPL